MNTPNEFNPDNSDLKPDNDSPDTGLNDHMAEDYPVLTEILSTLPDLVDAAQNETAWNELEQRLAGRILQRIEERVQFVLEEIIRQHLVSSIQKMTGTLVTEIRKDLQNTLDVVVTHAVTDELHRQRQKEFFSGNNHLKITEKNGPKS